jgi:hypothetical protein
MGDTVYGDKSGGDNVAGNKYIYTGGNGPAAPPRPRKVILLMSANPSREQPLRLDEERREIDRAVAQAQAGDRLEVHTADAVRLDDLQYALLRHRPAIAHFSGHGRVEGIQVTDDLGGSQPVPPEALSDLFRILGGGLQCVVLNACYTEEQAKAIAAHVPYVVGMRRQVLDDTAIRFSAGFYRAIAHAQSVRVSFDLARNSLNLHGVPDGSVPRLIAGPGEVDRPVIGAT